MDTSGDFIMVVQFLGVVVGGAGAYLLWKHNKSKDKRKWDAGLILVGVGVVMYNSVNM